METYTQERRPEIAANALDQFKVDLVETKPKIGMSLYHQEKARATTPRAEKTL